MNEDQLLTFIDHLITVAEGKIDKIGSIHYGYWELKGYLIALYTVKGVIRDTSDDVHP